MDPLAIPRRRGAGPLAAAARLRARAVAGVALAACGVAIGAAPSASPRDEEAGPPRAALRRLTRIEFEHTLRDLLALPGLEVRALLPEDGRSSGSDKAAALDVSHVHVAGWYAAARAALAAAGAAQPAPPKPTRETLLPGAQEFFKLALLEGDAVFLRDGRYDQEALPIVREALPHKLAHYERSGLFPYRHSVGLFRRQAIDDHFAMLFDGFSPIRPGRYRLRLSVWSFRWEKGAVLRHPTSEAVTLHADDRLLGTFDAPSLEPTVHEIETWLEPGERILFTAATLPAARVYRMPGRAAEYVGPGVAIDRLEVEGPLVGTWPPESHRRVFGDLPLLPAAERGPRLPRRPPAVQLHPGALPRGEEGAKPWAVTSGDPAGDAKRLLTSFLSRAYRRPVKAAEISVATALVARRLKQGEPFEEALRTACAAALCSPEFLFLGGPPGPLDDWRLASRLSYFLWDSMPDEQLFARARRGELSRPDVLRAEVDRLLDDPRSARFVAHFVDEWLDVRALGTTTPDAALYPDFDPLLLDSMRSEARAFFAELVRADEPVGALVRSEFAMLDRRMARHYFPPDGVVDGEPVRDLVPRRVPLPPGSPRGGILGLAAVHTLTANGTVTSPVKRGAWVLRTLLGEPPEPPPAGVPAVDPDVRGAVSIRDELARHTADASCASCHASIDPPGFALEGFDAVGAWRDRYAVVSDDGGRTLAVGPPVDTSCILPDGRACGSFEEYRDRLLADPDVLARALAGHLVLHATGVPVGPGDAEELERIVASAPGRGVRELIHAVVASRLFLEQ